MFQYKQFASSRIAKTSLLLAQFDLHVTRHRVPKIIISYWLFIPDAQNRFEKKGRRYTSVILVASL